MKYNKTSIAGTRRNIDTIVLPTPIKKFLRTNDLSSMVIIAH